MVVSPAKPPPASAVENSQPFYQPQRTNWPPLNRPVHWPHFISSLPTSLSLITGLTLPTLTSNRPTNKPLFICSLLTGLRLITGLVLPSLASNCTTNWPIFISSLLTVLQWRTMKKPVTKWRIGVRGCYEVDEPTTICEELRRNGRSVAIVLNSFKLS